MDIKNLAKQKDVVRGREPIVYILDAEISPARGLFYPPTYDAKVIHVELPQKIISLAWKKAGSKRTHCKSIFDYKGQKPGIENINDFHLAQLAHELIEEADLVIGHNVRDFDMKILRTRMAVNGFQPPDEGKTEDTLKILRKYFRLEKNTLDYACEYFGIGTKSDRRHAEILPGFLEGNPKDIKDMVDYNKQDVVINEKLWKTVSPWHKNSINLNLIARQGQRCKICLANARKGTDYTTAGKDYSSKTLVRQKYRCKIDGHIWRGEVVARASKQEIIEEIIERVDEYNV